jgi:Uma2 family endonuclease
VVELRSGSDNLLPLQRKLQQYMDNGAQLGWLIDSKNRQVEIYRVPKPVETLATPTELFGEDVLPGFVLKLNRIWT